LPAAKALDPALESLQPFFRKTREPIAQQIRPFTKQTLPFVKNVRNASQPLSQAADGLDGSFSELNQLLNGLAYNPPGQDEGYLFYLSWLNHNANSSSLVEDSGGPILRGIAMYSCAISTLADNALLGRPGVDVARTLTRLPTTSEIC
jgi:phospholipid/cholesterol/gamma-HCH transport system substrate-binding protein